MTPKDLRLTGTGWLVLAMGAAFYLSALTSQAGLLLLLAGVALGCLLVNLAAAWRTVGRLDIHAPSSTRVLEGGGLSEFWMVVNRGKRAARLVRAESPQGILFRLGSVAAGARERVRPEMVFERRGVFKHDQLRLVSIAPFGLVRAGHRLQLKGEVVVGPAVYPVAPPEAAGYDAMLGGKLKGRRAANAGADFAGVRPFQDGDSLKQVHWKSSAKGLGLMVKTFEEELSGRVSFILDNGRTGRAKILDDCVRAAGSLMFAALEAGHHVELIDLERLELLLLPPSADGGEILEALARLPLAPGGAARPIESAVALVSGRSAICFVLTEVRPELESTLNRLLDRRRRVSIYLPEDERRSFAAPGAAVFAYSGGGITPIS